MDLQISGLRVLVTAGARGIGREIARSFVREGARVHVCDVDQTALDELAGTDPAITRSLTDVADRGAVERLFGEAVAALGGLDVLVNNAGIAGPTARVEEIAPEDWDRTLAINITGQFNCARLAVPYLRESRNGSIVNLASAAGRFGFSMRTPYAASKWAVVGFTKSLSRELGEFGIRVNAVLPGVVAGERIERVIQAKADARGVSYETVETEMVAASSMGEMVTGQQMADHIVFICSPLGKTVSGQAIAIDADLQMLV